MSADMRPIAYFDLDDTLVFGDSMLHWQAWYIRHRRLWHVLPWIWQGVAQRALGRPDVWLKRTYMATAARESEESLISLARQFSREMLSQCGFVEMVSRAWLHHHFGYRIVVVTASPSFYLGFLEDMLPPHELVSTRLSFPGRRIWQLPELPDGNVKGAGKIDALRRAGLGGIAPAGSFAYSDHPSDQPLFEMVDHPHAVNPHPELVAEAVRRGWPLLHPVTPFPRGETLRRKLAWLLLGPVAKRWPWENLPEQKARRSQWKKWADEISAFARCVESGGWEACQPRLHAVWRHATRLKGLAPRLTWGLLQRPLSILGLDGRLAPLGVWGGGQPLARSAEALDRLQRLAWMGPGCDQARLLPAPMAVGATSQIYRVRREGAPDYLLKVLHPFIHRAIAEDIETGWAVPPEDAPDDLRRAWKGLLGELEGRLRSEVDLLQEAQSGAALRELFADPAEGIEIPESWFLHSHEGEGLLLEELRGLPLHQYLAYLRETRALRDPKRRATREYEAFAAIATQVSGLPQGRDLGLRLWRFLSTAWSRRAYWFPISGRDEAFIVPSPEGWRLGICDLASLLRFPDTLPERLRRFPEGMPEGSGELRKLMLDSGWAEDDLDRFRGRWRELVELVWHPVLAGDDERGFAFEDWRLDRRLQALLGAGHVHEAWPIPDLCRPVFRTLHWLRRHLMLRE